MAFEKGIEYFVLPQDDYFFLLATINEFEIEYSNIGEEFQQYTDPVSNQVYYFANPDAISDNWDELNDAGFFEINFLRARFINSTQASIYQ